MTARVTSDFWTRRKAAVAAETAQETEQAKLASLEEQTGSNEQVLDERSEAEILQQLDLPDPDSLRAGDDFSAFMKEAVPASIRRRALRKLWLTNPILANLDELVDYGEDFTDAATVIDNLQTTYQVGKGMLQHVLATSKDASDPETASDENPDTDDAEIGEQDQGTAIAQAEAESTAPEVTHADTLANGGVDATDASFDDAEPDTVDAPIIVAAPVVTAPRRMRFRITS